ncbi:SGNH/GDSL hydrolase family protein [Engelhardtia mirabilis]|uniref:SGNH hydrolase-type esterase domain-containing protein n=1 Tax=Engelhardtia mirabilis TaxID=2528011 RepID=A0A518BGJ9_9BACT|nr:hypothetical protein Pla133_11610 [Planctomycetes bacterium Pla133]QDV00422.1 hypothetical protein Pla86_11610 [Planctomycetes bacterium Pla86]
MTAQPLPKSCALLAPALLGLVAGCSGQSDSSTFQAEFVPETTSVSVPSLPVTPVGPVGPALPTAPLWGYSVNPGFVVYPPGDFRILPLGDSITIGFGGIAGYRFPLWLLLGATGFKGVDFVGASTAGSPIFVPDPEHEGHSGWRVRDFSDHSGGGTGPDSTIELILAAQKPRVILLHAGTNDLWSTLDWQDAPGDLGELLDRIDAYDPRVVTVVAKILPTINDPVNLSVHWLNDRFHEVVYQRWLAGQNVQLVDMSAACPVLSTVDGVHPDPYCYNAMALTWLSAISSLGSPVEAPAVQQPFIPGVVASATSEEVSYAAALAVDGSGLNAELHDDETVAPLAWRSQPFDQVVVDGPDVLGPSGVPETFTLDLPAPYDVVQVELWNGRNDEIVPGIEWKNLESIRRIGVETSVDGVVWDDRGELALVQGPPRDVVPPQVIDVDWPGTLAVRFTVLATYAKLPFGQTHVSSAVSLSEVRLRGTAAP